MQSSTHFKSSLCVMFRCRCTLLIIKMIFKAFKRALSIIGPNCSFRSTLPSKAWSGIEPLTDSYRAYVNSLIFNGILKNKVHHLHNLMTTVTLLFRQIRTFDVRRSQPKKHPKLPASHKPSNKLK